MPKGWRSSSSSYSNEPSYETIKREGNQIFISYAWEDESAAMRLYYDLKNARLNPWIDRKKILPGLPAQEWQREIRNAILSSPYFIPLFSSISVNKIGYVQNEFNYALKNFRLNEDVTEFLPYYIPVRLDDCELPSEESRNIGVVDLFPYNENWKEGVEMIVRRITDDIDIINDVEKHYDIAGKLFYMQDRHNEAIDHLNRALERAPNDLYKLAIIKGKAVFLNELERYDEAIECIDTALKDLGTIRRSWTLWLEKGNTLYSLGKYHEAIECYDRSSEREPEKGEIWYKKGLALMAIGESYAANQCFDKAKQLGYSEE